MNYMSCRTVEYGHESRRDSEPRITALARTNRNCKRQTRSLVRDHPSYKKFDFRARKSNPCGGGVEYLHRDPASCTRRRKGKSQIRDSKILSRVPRE
jgi:hypothetical protein